MLTSCIGSMEKGPDNMHAYTTQDTRIHPRSQTHKHNSTKGNSRTVCTPRHGYVSGLDRSAFLTRTR